MLSEISRFARDGKVLQRFENHFKSGLSRLRAYVFAISFEVKFFANALPPGRDANPYRAHRLPRFLATRSRNARNGARHIGAKFRCGTARHGYGNVFTHGTAIDERIFRDVKALHLSRR